MPLPKKIWTLSKFDKGLGNYNAEGMFWWAQGLDFDFTPPFIRVAPKLFKETDSSITANLQDSYWSTIFNNTNYIINRGDGRIFQSSYPNIWSEVHRNLNTWGGLGLFGDEDYMYYASNSYAGRYDKTTWTDSWQTFNTSNLSELCPITKFLKFICFGNKNYLATWDTAGSAWNATRLTLPSGYQIKWLLPLTDYLVISAHHNAYGSALFFWDGISQTYNRVLQLPNVLSLAGVVDKNALYVITNDGWINLFNGVGLTKLNRFPDMELGDIINLYPDTVKIFQGLIYIGKAASGYDMTKRFYPGGIWVFNPQTKALYFKHMMSNGGVTNQGGYGVITILTIILTQGGGSFKVLWYQAGGSVDYVIDVSNDTGANRPYNWGAIFVTPLLDDEPYRRKRFIQSILNFYKPLVNSSFARIVVKYNVLEKYQKDFKVATAGGYDYFDLAFGWLNFEVGDEVTVLSGGGAGQIRHITSIEAIGGTRRFHMDETLYNGASYNGTSYLLLTGFKKVAVIKGSDYAGAVNKMMRFNARSKKIQMKIEIWSPSGFTGEWDMGLADISTVYIPDRIIK